MLMEPVWSPEMQCAVQHTHTGALASDLALIHAEYPSGRIPCSVAARPPPSDSHSLDEKAHVVSELRKHKCISCPNARILE